VPHFFFGDVPHFAMLAGAVTIIAAGVYIFVREQAALRWPPIMVDPPA